MQRYLTCVPCARCFIRKCIRTYYVLTTIHYIYRYYVPFPWCMNREQRTARFRSSTIVYIPVVKIRLGQIFLLLYLIQDIIMRNFYYFFQARKCLPSKWNFYCYKWQNLPCILFMREYSSINNQYYSW